MAVAGIANHAEHAFNPLAEERLAQQSATGGAQRATAANNTIAEDTYTPSTANSAPDATAQAAGIFQVTPAALTGNTVLAQPGAAGDPNAAQPQPAQATTTNPETTQAAANADTAANTGQQAGVAVSQSATSGSTGSNYQQSQVQSLNTALAALGLSNYDILQIDRIAKVIQDFNPSAYTDLVNQFEEQVQQTSQPAAPNAATPVVPVTNPAASANAGTAANSNTSGSGYQVQGISITYAGLPAGANPAGGNGSGQGSTANISQNTPANLQVQQVQISLVNGNGQTIQVQAPQQSTNAGTPNLQSAPKQVANT
jgi:hypothetical protein